MLGSSQIAGQSHISPSLQGAYYRINLIIEMQLFQADTVFMVHRQWGIVCRYACTDRCILGMSEILWKFKYSELAVVCSYIDQWVYLHNFLKINYAIAVNVLLSGKDRTLLKQSLITMCRFSYSVFCYWKASGGQLILIIRQNSQRNLMFSSYFFGAVIMIGIATQRLSGEVILM